MKRIAPSQLKSNLEQGHKVQLIDVRSTAEYAAGHVPGALNVPMDQIESRLDDLAADTEVILVCQSGNRACMTHDMIEGHHNNLTILDGGTKAWQECGLPVVSSTRTRWSLDRQVRLGAGMLVLIGVILSVTVQPGFIWLAGFVGAGLTFAGLTDVCGMAALLAKMPWNRPATPAPAAKKEVKA